MLLFILITQQRKKPFRIRLYKRESDAFIAEKVICIKHHCRGKAGADLYNPLWSIMAEHGIQDEGIAAGKISIPEIIAEPGALFLLKGELSIILGEFANESELVFYMVVDPWNALHPALKKRRFIALDKGHIGQWGIEMSRRCEPKKRVRAILIVMLT
jgi:hypothetical protein